VSGLGTMRAGANAPSRPAPFLPTPTDRGHYRDWGTDLSAVLDR
jgi:hypothetical protein